MRYLRKIFEYEVSFDSLNYTINGLTVAERAFNKVKFCHIARPIRDKYDDGDFINLYSYDLCLSCARRLAEFIDKEKANHENL